MNPDLIKLGSAAQALGGALGVGLLVGLERGWDLARCAALGNQIGALKVAARGPQNYVVDVAMRAQAGLS